MSKLISDLSRDIYNVLDATKEHEHDATTAAQYATRIGDELAKATQKRDKLRRVGKLWASDLGKKCLRQHHYNFNEPTKAEPLSGHTKFKFLYGNVLEEAVLYLAEEAGHSVRDAQRRVETTMHGWQVSGRIDGTVDDTLIDVKSTSSFGFKRYKEGIDATNDSFGYLEQLGFYANYNDWGHKPKTDEAGFVWIDKQNGHIAYTPVKVCDRQYLEDRAGAIIEAVESDESSVARGYTPKDYGKSGNKALDIGCAYCSYKVHCWRDSNGGVGLRGFAYSHAPVFFTEINRQPNQNVQELTLK